MFSLGLYVGQYRHQHDDESKQVIPRNHNNHPFRKARIR